MSVRKDNLYELVKSLTAVEKRYFKSFVQGRTNTPDSKYLQLFNILVKQKKYDESLLLKNASFGQNSNLLGVTKNYLYQLILKSLRNNSNNQTSELAIAEMLLDIESMYTRRLFDSAAKVAEKARKMAEQYFHFDLLITISSWEKRLVEHTEDSGNYLLQYESILQRETDAARQLRLISIYFNQYKKLSFSNHREGYHKTGRELQEFLSLMKIPELENYRRATNPLAKLFFNFCYFEYYLAIQEQSTRYQLAKLQMNLFSKYPNLLKKSPFAYLKSLVVFLTTQLYLGMFEAFDQNIQLLENLKVPDYAHPLKRYQETEFLHMSLYREIAKGKFEKAVREIIPKIEQFHAANNGNLIYQEEFFLKWEVAWVYLGLRDYEKALEWIIPLEFQSDNDFFSDHFTIYSLIQMMIHFEIKDNKAVLDHADNLFEALSARQKLGNAEIFVIRFFRLASESIEDKKQQRKLLLQLKEQCQTLKKVSESLPVYPMDNIIWWVDSLLQNKSIAEILVESSPSQTQAGRKEEDKLLVVFQDPDDPQAFDLLPETQLVG